MARQRFGDETIGGALQTLRQLGQKGPCVEARFDHRQELDQNLSGLAQKAAARPEHAGVQRHGQQRRARLGVDMGDAIPVGGRRADRPARPLGKDEDLPTCREASAGALDDLADSASATLTSHWVERAATTASELHETRLLVESLYREIRALRIYEGASDVQKVVIARQVAGAA